VSRGFLKNCNVFSFCPIVTSEDGAPVTAQLRPPKSLDTAGQTFDVTHPATGERVATFPVHTADDVRAAVDRARQAQQWWADLGFGGRRKRINKWITWIARHSDEICDLGFRETGKPKGDVQFELVASLEDLRWAAAHAQKVLGQRRVAPGLAMVNFDARLEYAPLGVAGVIAPWNFPIYPRCRPAPEPGPCLSAATPRRCGAWRLRSSTGWPPISTRPVSGANWPESILTTVLFPAPLCPQSAWISPAPTVSETSLTAGTPAKLRASRSATTGGAASATGMLAAVTRGCTAPRTCQRRSQ
jgi:hypothetical protein